LGLLKSFARQIVFPAIIRTGFENIISHGVITKHLTLMYHGVVNKANPDLSVNHLSKSDFEKHLVYLKKHFNVIPLSEIFDKYRNNSIAKQRTIAITFDDGYENNYINAFPLLKKYNLPATIFVAAQCLHDTDEMLWYDIIDLFKSEINLNTLNVSDIQLDPDKKEILKKIKTIPQLKVFFKTLNTIDKKTITNALFKENNVQNLRRNIDTEFWKMLNTKQMQEMSNSGLIEIASHSVTHPNLDTLSQPDLENELKVSKMLIEESISKEVTSIAFPDGAYNEEVKKMCLKFGYKNLLAVDYRTASDKNDKNILPRFCISNTTTIESNMISLHRSFAKIGF
jgi:peptidoglycan/xylan/chitin deacetylase (PgdA/CDA1 family)